MIRRGTARSSGQLRGLLWAACCFACAYPVACGVCEMLVRSGLTPKASVDAATVILALLMAPVPAVIFLATCAKHDAMLTRALRATPMHALRLRRSCDAGTLPGVWPPAVRPRGVNVTANEFPALADFGGTGSIPACRKRRIGISGWSYVPWRGVFYPKGLSQKANSSTPAARLNSIEINGTFYSLQRPVEFRSRGTSRRRTISCSR